MEANSNTKPQDIIKCKDRTIVNYDIKQIEITDMEGVRTVWEYDYVEIEGKLTKAKFKKALEKKDLEKKDVEEWIPDEVVLEWQNEK